MKIRPQVLGILIALSGIGVYSISMDMVEIATACVAGLCALSMKLIEKDDGVS